MMVGDVAMICEGIICKTCVEMTSRILRKEFPHLQEWCGEHLWAPGCYHGSVGQGWDVVKRYISTQNCSDGEKEL